MMQAFRNSAKPVVLLITITFLVWMVVDLSGLSGGGGILTQTSAGSINGTSIDSRAYQQAVQDAITQRQRESVRSLSIEEIEQVRDEVWEGYVQQLVLSKEIESRHIQATDDEIAGLIANVPPPEIQQAAQFQSENGFDFARYQSWLATAEGRAAIPVLEARYRNEILRAKLLRNVTADIVLSDAELWQIYRDQNEATAIALTPLVPEQVVADSAVTVTDDEVASYYQENRDEFDRPETAFLSFITVSRRLDASDSAAALTRAQTVLTEVRSGAPFAEVAMRESSDGSAQNGGELGTMGKGTTVPEFEAALFSLPLNTVSEPVRTQFGYHLIEVTARTADSATARHILIPFELAGAHRDLVDAQADTLETLAADRLDPTALDTAARALRLPVGQAAPVQRGERVLVGEQLLGDPGVWAFQAQVGETSPVIETPEAFWIFRVDSLHKAGIPPLDQIREGVRNAVMVNKKEVEAVKIAERLIERVRAGEQFIGDGGAVTMSRRVPGQGCGS